MSVKKSPLSVVKEKFGSKEKLVNALIDISAKVIDRGEGESADGFRARLLTAANSKLLRLHSVGSKVAERFGSKEQLVDALLALENRGKDQDYRKKLCGLPINRLYDRYLSQQKRTRRAERQARAQA